MTPAVKFPRRTVLSMRSQKESSGRCVFLFGPIAPARPGMARLVPYAANDNNTRQVRQYRSLRVWKGIKVSASLRAYQRPEENLFGNVTLVKTVSATSRKFRLKKRTNAETLVLGNPESRYTGSMCFETLRHAFPCCSFQGLRSLPPKPAGLYVLPFRSR